MSISAATVKELRDKTGAGMMDCKKALAENDGDLQKAEDWLRQKGIVDAGKKADRIASEGLVESYIHMGGRIGVLIEVNCETDFVAKTDKFKELVHDLCLHIAAAGPDYVSREEIPAETVEHEKSIFVAQAKESGKPDNIIEKMVTGKLDKHLSALCLLDQPFVKDPDKSVGDLVKEATANIGEKITVRRFARYVMGEGLEKRSTDLAAEVAAEQAKYEKKD